jgi:Lon protease-like protein
MKVIKIGDLPKKISVFPLSNFILFPKTTVPLNIFEPRYVDMINDSMKSNKLIGMIQPKKKLMSLPTLFTYDWLSWKNNKF